LKIRVGKLVNIARISGIRDLIFGASLMVDRKFNDFCLPFGFLSLDPFINERRVFFLARTHNTL